MARTHTPIKMHLRSGTIKNHAIYATSQNNHTPTLSTNNIWLANNNDTHLINKNIHHVPSNSQVHSLDESNMWLINNQKEKCF